MMAEPHATDHAVQRPRRRAPALIGAAVLLAAGAAAWWAWAGAERRVPLDQLRVASVARGDLVRDAQVQGRAVAAVSPTLFAPAAGTVALVVQAGDTVAAGQVLARIAATRDEPRSAEACGAGIVGGSIVGALLLERLAAPALSLVRALAGTVTACRDGDFAFDIAWPHADELRAQRLALVQRERPLNTVVQQTPVAMVLAPDGGRINFAQLAARRPVHGAGRTAGTLPDKPLHADPAQLEQALINLLKNAHESGSDPAAIYVRAQVLPGEWRIEVLDRGGGMNEAVLAQALAPFCSTKRGGSGLGLALVRDIVEAHGGRIALAQRDGGGTGVTLVLPG